MKILFFGLPLAALLLARDGHEIVHAAICRKDARGVRRLRRVLGKDRVSLVPAVTAAFLADRRREQPDLVVSWFWTKRLPAEALTLAPFGAFGVHPSLLPRHRGPDPYFAALRAGDRETGVTAHRLDIEYDTGALLGQKRLSIDPAWNSWTLAKKLDRPSLALLRETAQAFASGTPPADIPQDEALATEAPPPSDDDLALDLAKPCEDLLRLIRAAAPWPGAFVTVGSETVVVTAAVRDPDAPRALKTGDATLFRGAFYLGAGDGVLRVTAGRLEDADDDVDAWPGDRLAAALTERL